jgi:hypothetical protein
LSLIGFGIAKGQVGIGGGFYHIVPIQDATTHNVCSTKDEKLDGVIIFL